MKSEEEFRRLRARLYIDIVKIDEELEQMPMLMMDAIEWRAKIAKAHEEISLQLKQMIAVKKAEIGEETVNGKPKSMARIDSEIPLQLEVSNLQEDLTEATFELNLWSGLCDAMRQKGHSLTSLGSLTISGYLSPSAVYEKGKAELAEGRAKRRKIIE